MLIAQSLIDGVPIVSNERIFDKYGVPVSGSAIYRPILHHEVDLLQ